MRHTLTRITLFLACLLWLALPVAGQPLAVQAAAAHAAAAPASQPVPAAFASPSATMFTFITAMKEITLHHTDQWATVTQCFDLSHPTTAPADEPQQVQSLAEDLYSILDRIGPVKPADFASAGQTDSNNRRYFRFFPRGEVYAWVRRKLGSMPPGQVALVKTASGQWKFSAKTLADAPDLAAAIKNLPDRSEGGVQQFVDLFGPTFETTPLWGWLVLLAAIFLGLAIGKSWQVWSRGLGHRAASRDRHFHATLLESAAGPLALAFLTAGLSAGLQFVHLEDDLASFVAKLLKLLCLLTVAWFLYNAVDLVDLALRHLGSRSDRRLDGQIVPLIRKSLRVFLVLVFLLLIAQKVFGVDITAWLAGLGIAGLAISLAAQNSLANLFGSITVFFDKPFIVGDRIVFDSVQGVVEEIGFRSTRLRTQDGHLVTIPNMKFNDTKVENVSDRPGVKRVFTINLAPHTPPGQIEQAVRLTRAALADPELAAPLDSKRSPAQAVFTDFTSAGPVITVTYWYQFDPTHTHRTYLEHAQSLNLKILTALAQQNIPLA